MTTSDASIALADLLRDPQRSGIYRNPESAELIRVAANLAGVSFVECRLEEASDFRNALALIGHALQFPDWYGENLDALGDCLTDLSWRENPDTVMALSGYDRLMVDFAAKCEALLDVFHSASAYWRAEGHSFWIFVDTSDRRSDIPEIGPQLTHATGAR